MAIFHFIYMSINYCQWQSNAINESCFCLSTQEMESWPYRIQA